MFGTLFFIASMLFAAYVLAGSPPTGRIDRGCLPVKWVGRAMTTVAAIGSAGAEAKMKVAAGEMFQGCRFFMFRQFYSAELEYLQSQRGEVKPTVDHVGGAQ